MCAEKAMAPHSSTLAWKIPWTEEPGRLQSMGSRRVRHNWATSLSFFTFMHWRRQWQPTPVFLPGESQGRGQPGGLPSKGSHRVRHDWSDLAAAAVYVWTPEGLLWPHTRHPRLELFREDGRDGIRRRSMRVLWAEGNKSYTVSSFFFFLHCIIFNW